MQALAVKIRLGALEAIHSIGVGHLGGALSVCDALAVLYGREMRIDPANPGWPERDKLVCSKGHAGPAVYAALALKGYFPYEELKTLNHPDTRLPSHCDRRLTPGVDMTTGSLGQGTSLACGMALGDRLRGRDNRIFLIVGDGETNEGQVWEAFTFAAAHRLEIWWCCSIATGGSSMATPRTFIPSGICTRKWKPSAFAPSPSMGAMCRRFPTRWSRPGPAAISPGPS